MSRKKIEEEILEDEENPYQTLSMVHRLAQLQAESGKGAKRHSHTGDKFEDQIICTIGKWNLSHSEGQAVKKVVEARNSMEPVAAIHELLGAINYLSAEVIVRISKLTEEEIEELKEGGSK